MAENHSVRDLQAMAVATMTKADYRQNEIMEELGITSQAEVSRLLTHARQNGWYVTELRIPPGVSAQVDQLIFADRQVLFDHLKRLAGKQGDVELSGLHIIHSGASDREGGESGGEDGRIAQFGRVSAERIADLLRPARTCAVAWGRTVNGVVEGLRRINPGQAWRQILFFPTSGEPIKHREPAMSASTAAALLKEHFQCSERSLSLSGVATRVPAKFDRKSQEAVRAFINMCKDYDSIFSANGNMDRVNAIVTGIGDVESSVKDPLFSETCDLEDITPDELNKRTVGNLGGVWLPRKDHDDKVEEMNKRWLGIQERHFIECGTRATKKSKMPGVIVVAVGAQKSAILKKALGRINHLVIDHELAKALLD